MNNQYREKEERKNEFFDAVALTRKHPGLSIKDIAEVFKKEFDGAEIEALIKQLST